MATIKEDIIAGNSFEEDELGATAMRRFFVRDVVLPVYANAGATAQQAILLAVDASTNRGLPRLGDPHPSLVGYYASRRRVDTTPSESATQAVVTIFYKSVPIERAVLDIVVNGATLQSTTDYDKDGNILWVAYNPSKGTAQIEPPPPTDGIGQGWNYSYVRAPVLLPNTTLEIVMREPPGHVPWAGTLVRRLNSKRWNGGNAGEWLCTGMTIGLLECASRTRWLTLNRPAEFVWGAQDFQGPFARWRVSYVFQYSPAPKLIGNKIEGGPGHKPLSLFVHNQTGVTPHGIDPKAGGWPDQTRGNGWAVADNYHPVDFDDLELPKLWP
jgi:hypothetical protein